MNDKGCVFLTETDRAGRRKCRVGNRLLLFLGLCARTRCRKCRIFQSIVRQEAEALEREGKINSRNRNSGVIGAYHESDKFWLV